MPRVVARMVAFRQPLRTAPRSPYGRRSRTCPSGSTSRSLLPPRSLTSSGATRPSLARLLQNPCT